MSIVGDVMSHNQSAFIPNMLITDNVIVEYECLHNLGPCKSHKTA